MHHMNNVVIMQTEQLGHIKALEEELCSTKTRTEELEGKLVEQDCIITQLVDDNLNHLQDNMRLTTHINSSQEQIVQLEHQLGQVRSVLMGMIEGAIKREGTDLLEAEISDASGNDQDNQGGDMGNGDAGASMGESMREDSPMLWEGGLIVEV